MHLIRTSPRYVPRRAYDALTNDLRAIYSAIDADRALRTLDAFEAKWAQTLPPVVRASREAREHGIPFRELPPEVGRVLYTTAPSRYSTDNYERRSRPRATSPPRTRPTSSSASPSTTPCRSGPERRGSTTALLASKQSTSETATRLTATQSAGHPRFPASRTADGRARDPCKRTWPRRGRSRREATAPVGGACAQVIGC